MTSKEKAKSMLSKMFRVNGLDNARAFDIDWRCAKLCALIAVDEIMKASDIKKSEDNPNKFVYTDKYWQSVREEIEKL